MAIIPAYNETTEALNSTIVGLLNSSRPPDEIHVVDDGSSTPAPRRPPS
ncbi:glycosyltransferase family A protein [Streptosporangium sp. NPDC051023]